MQERKLVITSDKLTAAEMNELMSIIHAQIEELECVQNGRVSVTEE
jgi:hypothetical protein